MSIYTLLSLSYIKISNLVYLTAYNECSTAADNACDTNTGALCVDTVDGYNCSCPIGYVLSATGFSCQGNHIKSLPAALILWLTIYFSTNNFAKALNKTIKIDL